MRIIIGISGASGSLYGVRLLWNGCAPSRTLNCTSSGPDGARKSFSLETGKNIAEIRTLADYSYSPEDISARLASGSYPVDAMVVAPCSIHTMSAIAHGLTSNLLTRAADVTLKERRRLISWCAKPHSISAICAV